MQPEFLDEATDWLRRAERDALASEQMLRGRSRLLDVAVYHAQQAAEKALKAFVVAHGEIFAKAHDLGPLVVQCQSIDPGFSRFQEAARILTPYAARFRYPGGPLEPSEAESRDALRLATEIVQIVKHQLSAH